MPQTAISRFREIRQYSEDLVKNLSDADMTVQSMPDASPAKWHLAHTTWFFETFLLKKMVDGYEEYDSQYCYLFNSYYESVGARYTRAQRGLITRPSKNEILAYRTYVDEAMCNLLDAQYGSNDQISFLLELGLNHEQQHQELLQTDILHLFAQNPLAPAYSVHIPAFEISSDLVTNKEWLEFIEEDGYQKPLLWLSDGWAVIQKEKWQHPLHWLQRDAQWFEMTLNGLQPLDQNAPVRHISYFEADAFATWKRQQEVPVRLPTELEWEVAVVQSDKMKNAFGQVWQWTKSPYISYPGFKVAEGAVGEYNGKFMCNQFVLRGSSSVTSVGHERITYRNFFYPHQRWQFTGLRLARDV